MFVLISRYKSILGCLLHRVVYHLGNFLLLLSESVFSACSLLLKICHFLLQLLHFALNVVFEVGERTLSDDFEFVRESADHINHVQMLFLDFLDLDHEVFVYLLLHHHNRLVKLLGYVDVFLGQFAYYSVDHLYLLLLGVFRMN